MKLTSIEKTAQPSANAEKFSVRSDDTFVRVQLEFVVQYRNREDEGLPDDVTNFASDAAAAAAKVLTPQAYSLLSGARIRIGTCDPGSPRKWGQS